jgi:hypothetical protein
MPSERQLNANRKNAALGGPKTESGRAAVRFNALKHGLTAATAVVPGEDPEAFQQLRDDMFEDYRPATHTERLLVEDFVLCSWRLLRLRRVETATWSAYIVGMRNRAGAEHPPTQEEADRALAGALADVPVSDLANFFRYERTTTRDFYRSLHELEAAQRTRRRAQPIPAAAEATSELAAEAPAERAAAAGCASAELSVNGIGTVLQPCHMVGTEPAPPSVDTPAEPDAAAHRAA